jgi:membrane-associated protease RseP (regulator of RpoE activity)
MYLAIAIVLIILSLIAHEAAHAYEMVKRGVPIEEAGLGMPIKFLPHARFRLSKFPNTLFTINPLLVMAYVKPSPAGEKIIQALPTNEQITIYGAGVVANIIFSAVLYILFIALDPQLSFIDSRPLLITVSAVIISLLVWFGRKFFCKYIVPLLGLATIILIAFTLAKIGGKALGGPATIGKMANQFSTSVAMAFNFAAVMSFNIALFNTLPIYGLDGGRVVDALLWRFGRTQAIFRKLGIIFLFILMWLVINGDISQCSAGARK